VGNKLDDVNNRAVTYEEAWKFSEQLGCLAYYESSAANDTNVDEIF
jgi:hypothetical protein